MKHVRIEYRVRPDVDLDELKRRIAGFVAGIGELGGDYTSFQDAKDSRHFVHVGKFREEVLPQLQAAEFFQAFTRTLRERCVDPPEAVSLEPVASTCEA